MFFERLMALAAQGQDVVRVQSQVRPIRQRDDVMDFLRRFRHACRFAPLA